MKYKLLVLSAVFCLFISFLNAQTWSQKSNINGNALSDAAGFGINGKGYIVLGKDANSYYLTVQEYDPVLNAWSAKANFIGPTRVGAVSFVIDSTAYVGLGSKAGGSPTYNDFYQYFPGLNIWVQRANYPVGSGRNSMGASVSGKGYVGGGVNGTSTPYSQRFYEYNPQINAWSQKANLPSGPRSTGLMFGLNGMIYFGLGHNGSQDFNDLWAYNPNLNAWSARASFPGSPRLQAKVVIVDGKAIVGGGFRLGVGTGLGDFYAYDPVLNSWTSIPSFTNSARASHTTFTINNTGYVCTGRDVNNNLLNDLWALSYNSVGLASSVVKENQASLFPNPASQHLYLSTSDYSNSQHLLSVFSLDGKLVLEKSILVNQEVTPIQINELKSGTYSYRITSENFTHSGKLLIQR